MSISRWRSQICLLAILALTLVGCELPVSLGDQSSVATAAVQTYQAQTTQEARLRAPTETTVPTATLEPSPTFTATSTLIPTLTFTLTPSPTSTPDRGWAGRWSILLDMLSGQPFYADIEQDGERVTTTFSVHNEEYFASGVTDAGGGRVNGAVYFHGERVAYFILEMQPGYKVFLGRWWQGLQSGSWCGGRYGEPAPSASECLLRD